MGLSAPPPPPPPEPDWHEMMSARRQVATERKDPLPEQSEQKPVERGDSLRDDIFEGLMLAAVICVAIFMSLGWIR